MVPGTQRVKKYLWKEERKEKVERGNQHSSVRHQRQGVMPRYYKRKKCVFIFFFHILGEKAEWEKKLV